MSNLERKLRQGQFVVTAELPVIDGGGHDEIARQLAPMEAFVDAFNATDNPSAHAHASPLAVAIGLRQAGVEPIMQLVCRDRNRLALEADLVGAGMFGVENICCLTGDDVGAGDEPEARRVFDLDAPQLISLVGSLAAGRYLSGRRLVPAPHFFAGAVENPGAPPFEYRARRAAKKADAGAGFLQLQICYRPELLGRFMEAAWHAGVSRRMALIPSICILRTVAGMRFVATRVPGIDVPAETRAIPSDPLVGSSHSSTPSGSSECKVETASPTDQAPLASSRIAISGPAAALTAATRSASPGSPTLTFTQRKPVSRAAAASDDARSGSAAAIVALTSTTGASAAPSSRHTGSPARRAARSCSARSTAACAAGTGGPPASAASTSATVVPS